MMKYVVLLLVSLFLLFSCDTEDAAPKELIPEDKMVVVIRDLMLLEAMYNTQLVRVKDKTERMVKYSDEVFEKHHITKEQFDASYEYYSKDMPKFEAMLELVFEELNKMETEAAKFNKLKEEGDTTVISP